MPKDFPVNRKDIPAGGSILTSTYPVGSPLFYMRLRLERLTDILRHIC